MVPDSSLDSLQVEGLSRIPQIRDSRTRTDCSRTKRFDPVLGPENFKKSRTVPDRGQLILENLEPHRTRTKKNLALKNCPWIPSSDHPDLVRENFREIKIFDSFNVPCILVFDRRYDHINYSYSYYVILLVYFATLLFCLKRMHPLNI